MANFFSPEVYFYKKKNQRTFLDRSGGRSGGRAVGRDIINSARVYVTADIRPQQMNVMRAIFDRRLSVSPISNDGVITPD